MDSIIIVLLVVVLIEQTYLLVKNQTKSISSRSRRPIFVDTSVLIDGRIIGVAQSGFITDTLVVPRSVVGELQFLADNADHDKRMRARHGLDVIAQLQAMPSVTVEVLQDGAKAEEGVDERLLKLAKQYDGAICTIDFNLNKVAQVENIAVLNVNELSQQLRMSYLPGEISTIELVQKGQDSHQAVGYLADGTMVVVEQAAKKIGQQVQVEFVRSLQTAAGKMMFAKLHETTDTKRTAAHTLSKPKGRKKPSAPKNPDSVSPRKKPAPSGSKNTAPKRKTSAQREASLIELVNNQE